MSPELHEAADGSADRKTLKPAGYDPFYGGEGGFAAMWKAYRAKADEIAAAVHARARKKEGLR